MLGRHLFWVCYHYKWKVQFCRNVLWLVLDYICFRSLLKRRSSFFKRHNVFVTSSHFTVCILTSRSHGIFLRNCLLTSGAAFFHLNFLSEIIRSPQSCVDRIKLFTRCLWDLAHVALWRHRGHFGAQTDLKLSNRTWNWEQRKRESIPGSILCNGEQRPLCTQAKSPFGWNYTWLTLQVGIYILGYTFIATAVLSYDGTDGNKI